MAAAGSPLMLKDVADRAVEQLDGDGCEPQLHEPEHESGLFEIRLRGNDFDLDDFKTMVRVGEDFGLGLKLDDHGSITLR
jgi:hypothetical protein